MGIGSLGSCDVMFEKQNYLLQGALYETGGAPDFHSGFCLVEKVSLNKYLFSIKGMFIDNFLPHLQRWIIKWKKGDKFYITSSPSNKLIKSFMFKHSHTTYQL